MGRQLRERRKMLKVNTKSYIENRSLKSLKVTLSKIFVHILGSVHKFVYKIEMIKYNGAFDIFT
jgi:hypothetical protein